MADKKSEKIPFLTKRKGKKGKRNVSVIQEEPKSGSGLGNNRETGLSDDMNDLSEEVITLKLNRKTIRSRSHKPHLTFAFWNKVTIFWFKYSHFGWIIVWIVVRWQNLLIYILGNVNQGFTGNLVIPFFYNFVVDPQWL